MSKTKNTKNDFTAITNKLGNTALIKKVPEEIALKYRVNVKPLSVNDAWQGKRYRSKKYDSFELLVKSHLPPKIELPEPPYTIHLKFGFSSAASDWDNPIKPTQDIIAKKYGFNDKLIRKGIVETEQVPKGSEYFEFELLTFKK